MSLSIVLSPQLENEVRQRAGLNGNINAVVEALVRRGIDAEVNEAPTENEIRRIDEAIDRGDADVAAGRVRPMDEVFSRLKAKYELG